MKSGRPVSRSSEHQKIIRMYMEQPGKSGVDMKDVAQWAIDHGLLPVPKPRSPVDMLASTLARAAQQERRTDEATGRPYRAYHSVTVHVPEGSNYALWYDIDSAPRPAMVKSSSQRRTGIINDAVQLSLDLDHWNRVNPDEDPIHEGFDLDDEVEWEKHARDAERDGAGRDTAH